MIETKTPDTDALENIFHNATADVAASASADRRAILQAENEIAKKYWGSFQPRIVLTFLAFAIAATIILESTPPLKYAPNGTSLTSSCSMHCVNSFFIFLL